FMMSAQHTPCPLFPYTTLFRSSPCAAAMAQTRWRLPYTDSRRGVGRDKCGSRYRAAAEASTRAWPYSPIEMSACAAARLSDPTRSEEHTSELQSRGHLVCRLLL